jgi:hypothetical protein
MPAIWQGNEMNIFLPVLLCSLLLRVCIRCCDCQPLLQQVQAAQLGFGQAIWQRQVDSKQAKRSCEGVEVEWDWCRAWWSSTHVATMHNTTLQLAAAAEVERRECSACHATFLQTGVSPVLVCISKRIKLLFLQQQASNSEKDLHVFH